MMKTVAWVSAVSAVVAGIGLTVGAQGPRPAAGNGAAGGSDWPEVRGPQRDGTSPETGLVDTWALQGVNFLWRAPYGGRSTPVVVGNRLYVQNPAGRDATLQERIMCLDVDTGRPIWEYKFNVFQSDVPAHRVGWASPAVDVRTGQVYGLGAGALVVAVRADGTRLWERSLGEEYAAFTTHGGRTMSPLIDGDLVIVAAAVSSWGAQGNRAHRLIALDKQTGAIRYVANPGGRPYDTAYAPPTIATIAGQRLLIAGLGDGGIYALKPQTGERVWSYVMSKRAINTGVVVSGTTVLASHGDENLDSSELGLLAAIDGSQTGAITTPRWRVTGTQFGFSSPVVDGARVYQIDNGAELKAFDVATGTPLWTRSLGTGQKAPLVLADGKLFVGTESGTFFILRPSATGAEVLSQVQLPVSTHSATQEEGTPEPVLSGAAIAHGRVFFTSSDAVYAFGAKRAVPAARPPAAAAAPARGDGPATWVQVTPTELILAPGQTVQLQARLFDGAGRYLRDAATAAWTLDGLAGTVTAGALTVAREPREQAGIIRAVVDGVTGEARARVVPPLPWTETFDGYPEGAVPPGWINAVAGKFTVKALGGQQVLQKAPDNTLFKRIRMFTGSPAWTNYTVEADVQTSMKRRQHGDIGVVAQRYTLRLYGNAQQLTIEPWEPETHRTVKVPFAWKPDTWYRLKLEVAPLPDGPVRVRGKVWTPGAPEPPAWTIEKLDPIGNRQGAPGFFVDSEFGAAIDNLTVTSNR